MGHWKVHKSLCKRTAAAAKEIEETGGDASEAAKQEVMEWYAQVPGLSVQVPALAWKLRSEQPVIVVEGGTNARLAKVSVMTRAMWTATGQAGLWEPRFASPTYRAERHYFVMISRSQSTGLVMTPRCLFPHPPELIS